MRAVLLQLVEPTVLVIHLLDAPPGAPGSSPGEEAVLPPFHHHVV